MQMDTTRTGEPSSDQVTPTTVFSPKQQHPLNAIFAPKAVAVIGATEKGGSVGRTVLWNLISNPFGGTVFPVNAKRSSILGIKAYPNLAVLPEQVELAVIATPAPTVPGLHPDMLASSAKAVLCVPPCWIGA